ncbi:Gti1/Pac2 family-domain-containing protein [Mycena sanguinolenta]|nr:Gti1/Pac2 family-domain-containing protein [Mycena sanguinolenta]
MAAPSPPSPTSCVPPWSGWIETTGDALLILEAARRGLIPRVTRRLHDTERPFMIASGAVFVFDEGESGIKRWTDGCFWSPSRILGNFLIYRETDGKGAGHGRRGKGGGGKGMGRSLSRPRSDSRPSADRNRERTLMGSLTNSYKFKADGLMKKTFSLTIAGVAQHLVSYYKVSDVESGRLRSPSTLPELASLDISPSLLERGNFRCPPKLEVRFAFFLVSSFIRFFLRSSFLSNFRSALFFFCVCACRILRRGLFAELFDARGAVRLVCGPIYASASRRELCTFFRVFFPQKWGEAACMQAARSFHPIPPRTSACPRARVFSPLSVVGRVIVGGLGWGPAFVCLGASVHCAPHRKPGHCSEAELEYASGAFSCA